MSAYTDNINMSAYADKVVMPVYADKREAERAARSVDLDLGSSCMLVEPGTSPGPGGDRWTS
jgi:hypothetical protein